MNAVRKIIEQSTDVLHIELPKEYQNKRLEVIVLELNQTDNDSLKKYNFSDLTGNLNWNEDPVIYQKKLRDEWE